MNEPHLDTQAFLESGYFLARKNFLLVMWEILGGMLLSFFWAGVGVLLIGALLFPLLVVDASVLPGSWSALEFAFDAVRSFEFGFAAGGLLWSGLLLTLSTVALIHGGIFGRLAHALRPEGKRATFWSSAIRHWRKMVGYTTLRWLVDAALGALLGVAVLFPLLLFLTTPGGPSFGWGVVASFGGVFTCAAALLFTLWRVVVLGPLLLEGEHLFSAMHRAAKVLGENLGAYLRLGLGFVLVVSPAYLVYFAFLLLTTASSTQAELSTLSFGVRMIMDLAFTLAVAAISIYGASTFLIRYAHDASIIESLPKAPPKPAQPVRGGAQQPLRLGQPISIPNLPGGSLVVMPLPRNFDNVHPIRETFPDLDARVPRPEVPEPEERIAEDAPLPEAHTEEASQADEPEDPQVVEEQDEEPLVPSKAHPEENGLRAEDGEAELDDDARLQASLDTPKPSSEEREADAEDEGAVAEESQDSPELLSDDSLDFDDLLCEKEIDLDRLLSDETDRAALEAKASLSEAREEAKDEWGFDLDVAGGLFGEGGTPEPKEETAEEDSSGEA